MTQQVMTGAGGTKKARRYVPTSLRVNRATSQGHVERNSHHRCSTESIPVTSSVPCRLLRKSNTSALPLSLIRPSRPPVSNQGLLSPHLGILSLPRAHRPFALLHAPCRRPAAPAARWTNSWSSTMTLTKRSVCFWSSIPARTTYKTGAPTRATGE
ncbi:hypothetical protein BU26DRAFT_252258 [Trematosphaeria pertusa]|uniref:Uncharacterized protein n=1 Tax=Trematosphaeria pertusa TaxID=390896 RepID=A0A6A6IP40_9PLEO|nr:uncharacterized protein BU26DRAFT_252258 [Trematosphaeria pertusa]KAF2252166.1 hypothetical protein BU26DRAFT_252258 [Trematosphaeria pertusa]